MREKTVEWALKEKIIAIVRGMEAKDCLRVAQALYDGGIRLMEITYDQRDPAQWAKTADAIGKIAEAFEGRMLVGAGTVTTPELVTRTRDAGGQFIISPDTNPAVIARTRELELVSMPGAMTPSEILAAHAAGADLVKLFPAAALGSAYLKAVRSPISHVRIMAVGGVDLANAEAFFKAGAACIGVGSSLVSKKLIDSGDYAQITARAEGFVRAAGK